MTVNKNERSFNKLSVNNFFRIALASTSATTAAPIISTGAVLRGVSWNPSISTPAMNLTHGQSGTTIMAAINSVVSGGVMGLSVLCLSGIYYNVAIGNPDYTVYYEPIV